MQLLVNTPHGTQEILQVSEGGSYFDAARVLWDESVDGELPPITLGGMTRVGDALVYDQLVMDATTAVSQAAETLRLREVAKVQRAAQVEQITVTTQAGNTFDGDEVSQGRMARAIIALQATGTPSTVWVLANNTPISATAAELTEALVLSGMAQAAIWVI